MGKVPEYLTISSKGLSLWKEDEGKESASFGGNNVKSWQAARGGNEALLDPLLCHPHSVGSICRSARLLLESHEWIPQVCASGDFQLLDLQGEPWVQARPISHVGLRNQANPDPSPGRTALRPCSSWKEGHTLSFTRRNQVSSWQLQTYRMKSRGLLWSFLTARPCPPFSLCDVSTTWRTRGPLGLHTNFCLSLPFLPQWHHLSAAQPPPAEALDLGPSIPFPALPSSPHASVKMWKMRGLFSCRGTFTSYS